MSVGIITDMLRDQPLYDRSRRHEAAAASRISPSRRQAFFYKSKAVIFSVTGGA